MSSHQPAEPRSIISRLRAGQLLAGAVLVVAVAACGTSGSSSNAAATPKASSSLAPASSSGSLPASDIPSSAHPDLSGMSITIANQGSPSVGRISTYNLIKILRSWGANAHLMWASSPQIASSSILRGSAQVLISTIPNLLPGVENGFGVKAFGLASPRLDYAMVGAKGITSLAQLKGKTVGVYNGSPSDITWVLMAQALQHAGLTTSDVHVVVAGTQGHRIDALAAGRIQASPLSHLALIQLRSQGVHDLYDFTTQDTNLYNAVLWATPSWLAANPKMAVAVDMAELESFRQLDNPAQQQALVQEDLQNTPGGKASAALALLKMYQKYDLFPPNAILTSAALKAQEQVYFQAHTITKDWALSRWATLRYDRAALQVVGSAP